LLIYLTAKIPLFLPQRESNDSGTESDGELLDVENQRHLDVEMETSKCQTASTGFDDKF